LLPNNSEFFSIIRCFDMGTSKLSPDERLLRKRLAAKLRQQRCRARKKKMAALKAEERSQPSVVAAGDRQARSPPGNSAVYCPRSPELWSNAYHKNRDFSALPRKAHVIVTPSAANGPSPRRAPLDTLLRISPNRPITSRPTMPPFEVTPNRPSHNTLCPIEKTAIDAMLSLHSNAKTSDVDKQTDQSTPYIPPLTPHAGNSCSFPVRNTIRSEKTIPYKFHKYRGDILLRRQPTSPGFYLYVRPS